MANTSTVKCLDELIIKAISAIRKSLKRPDETRIIKTFLENCDIERILGKNEAPGREQSYL